MSGVAVIRYLLSHNSALNAVVPAIRIMGGDLPIGIALPAISVKEIDSVPRLSTGMNEAKRLHTERVQVTPSCKGSEAMPQGGGYPQVKSLLKLLLAACPNSTGTINGIDVDSILPDVEGPDLSDLETGILSQSRDFIVRYRA